MSKFSDTILRLARAVLPFDPQPMPKSPSQERMDFAMRPTPVMPTQRQINDAMQSQAQPVSLAQYRNRGGVAGLSEIGERPNIPMELASREFDRAIAAVRTLESMGYTWQGGTLWEPGQLHLWEK